MSKVFPVLDRLLSASEQEIISQYCGNLVMVITEKIQNENRDASLELLKRLLTKLMKSALPTTVQGISLYFSRLINRSTKESIDLLLNTTIKNKIALKILLDRWLLHQPKFIG
jgi:hypothetical protein